MPYKPPPPPPMRSLAIIPVDCQGLTLDGYRLARSLAVHLRTSQPLLQCLCSEATLHPDEKWPVVPETICSIKPLHLCPEDGQGISLQERTTRFFVTFKVPQGFWFFWGSELAATA